MDRAPGSDRLILPAMQQTKQPFRARLELLARLTLNPGKHAGNRQLDWLISMTATRPKRTAVKYRLRPRETACGHGVGPDQWGQRQYAGLEATGNRPRLTNLRVVRGVIGGALLFKCELLHTCRPIS
jgi:hypothetical protein